MTITTAPHSQVSTSVRPAGLCVIVIFGAAGDLTKRLLLPALYNLAGSNLLPQEFAIIGVAHTPMSQDDFCSKLSRDIHEFATVADVWSALPTQGFPNYAAGSWGPKDADELLWRDGRQWRC